MSVLYSNIHTLCEKEGIKDGTLCSNIGIRRSFLSELKAGRTKSLSAEVLSKIATYFNVSVDYLLTGNQKENPPSSRKVKSMQQWSGLEENLNLCRRSSVKL